MHNIETAAGQVVAADTQKSVDAVDQAVMSLANLCASIVEVSKSSDLPVSAAQGALANTGASLANVIACRSGMSEATRELVAIQRGSSLRETSFGCPGGFATEGRLKDAHPAKDMVG